MTDTSLPALTVRVETAVKHFAEIMDLRDRLYTADLALVRAEVKANAELARVQFDAQKEAVAAALAASQVATAKSEADQNKRLAEMNNFRETINDVISRFLTRKEAVGFLAGAVGLLAAIITLALKF